MEGGEGRGNVTVNMGQQLSLSLYFFFSHSHLTHDFVSESNIKIKETKSLLSGELWKITQ